MGPKKRSPASISTEQHYQPIEHPGEADTAFDHPSPPKGKRRRQPRDSGPGISPVQSSSTRELVDPVLSSLQPPDSPHHSSDGTPPESGSRRQSTSSTMRSGPMESSQTPTGRISKAKKGKRVHACSFQGCGKVSLTALSFLSCAAALLTSSD